MRNNRQAPRFPQCDGCHATTTVEGPTAVLVRQWQSAEGYRLQLCADCVAAGDWICAVCAEVHSPGPCPWQELYPTP